jgi:signal transduction histidine kinase
MQARGPQNRSSSLDAMKARGALVAILFAGIALPFNTPFALFALIPIYLARSRWMTIAGTVAVGAAMAAHDLIWDTEEPFGAYAASLALCVMAGALGMYSGVRRAAAARERELLAEAAAAEERLRIARELHDAVGHDVSLMVVQAQALGATDERVREATDAIADLGRRTMADLHRTLRVLRGDEEAARAPGAGLADLDGLVEIARASGLPLTVVVDGAPRELAPLVDQSAYRIVQEAVTNVVKHADRAPTTVTLGYGEEGLELTISDAGNGGQISQGGHGLVGMRERAELFGGTLEAGPRNGQGFEVRAVLPYQ